MKYFFFIGLLLTSQSYAQYATSSFFGSTVSANPGVIVSRIAGFTTVAANQDKIQKTQEFTGAQAGITQNGTSETTIGINTMNFFRGGKGGGLTSELKVDLITGTKNDILKTATETTDIESTATVTNLNYGFGSSGIGFAFFNTTYKYTLDYNFTLDGNNNAGSFKGDMVYTGAKVGLSGNLGSLFLGAYGSFMMGSIKTTGSNALENTDEKNNMVAIGFGVGIKTPKTHIEFGLEKPAVEPPEPEGAINVNKDPKYKAVGVVEFKWGGMLLGYMGTYYSGNYSDPELIVENQLAYEGSTENRLVNKINIAFGADKGFSLGGSYFTSSQVSQEKVPFIGQTNIDTNVKSTGASVNLSYVF